MISPTPLYAVILSIVISIILFFYGLFAMLNPKKLGYYMVLLTKGNFDYVNNMVKQDSFILRHRVAGFVIILFSLILFFSTIKELS